jgi:periplasmic divalent cation tolerance protein
VPGDPYLGVSRVVWSGARELPLADPAGRARRLDACTALTLMPHTDAITILTTVATADEAVTLVRALLERRLIACGTLVPGARSLYRWEGKIADEQEVLVVLKTRAARLESLRAAFGELHPYKVPELLALPVSAGHDKYLAWINKETTLALA